MGYSKEWWRESKWGNVLGPITLKHSAGLILLTVLRIPVV